jgi:ubiquinone/menaquinone biosynthesis C-methylase UbiE
MRAEGNLSGYIVPSTRRDGSALPDDQRQQPTLVAVVDRPATTTCNLATPVCEFRGWVATASEHPAVVRVRAGGDDVQDLIADLPRPDVMEIVPHLYPKCTHAGGFRLIVKLPESRNPLNVVLEFTDGAVSASSSPYQLLPQNGSEVVRANYKGVWNEVASDVNTAKLGVGGTTDEGEFDRTARYSVSLLESTVGIHPDDVVLEIGAGVGRVGAELAPMCQRWIGADVSENMLGHLRERLHGHPNVETVPLNGWDLSLVESESVDVVYATIVFMHLDEWDRYSYVQEGFRVLKAGGRMYVDNINLLSEYGWKTFRQVADEYHPLARPPHVSKMSTPQELQAYLDRAGFIDVKVGNNPDVLVCWAAGRKP